MVKNGRLEIQNLSSSKISERLSILIVAYILPMMVIKLKMGTFSAGDHLLGRDGVNDMSKNLNDYGEEWQVRDTEPKLFQDQRAPQYPDRCIYLAYDGDQIKKSFWTE